MGRVIRYTPAQLEPATPRQIRAVTKLCQGLKIKEPLEERPMTVGGAGRLIRELTNLKRGRRKK